MAVAYEQERGLREVGQSSTGAWRTSGSKTIATSAARAIEAFTDETVRTRWLPGIDLALRTHRPAKSVTADFKDATGTTTRISVGATVKTPEKNDGGRSPTRNCGRGGGGHVQEVLARTPDGAQSPAGEHRLALGASSGG